MMDSQERLIHLLAQIYGPGRAPAIADGARTLMDACRTRVPRAIFAALGEGDALLITYPDQVQAEDQRPLACLQEFLERHLGGLITCLHLLPFYPSSSDDGFSVMDYRAVDPQFGAWSNVEGLGQQFRLMFDAVINHASAESPWFRAFLKDQEPYRDFFISLGGNPDLSGVVRPRTMPLLTNFDTRRGKQAVWTTFGPDQIDLNYGNPAVLLEMLSVLLFYVSEGAYFIRLDAVAYLWKQMGTRCVHLPQTHLIVQLIREILDQIAPQVMIVTETNVPQEENLSYYGNGTNEAQLVYNFALPPLVLHAFQTGRAETLARWASALRLPSDRSTLFNMLASHDGVGLNPVRGILSESEIESIVSRISASGGLVSSKSDEDGTLSPYELNVNYFDALDFAGQPEAEVLRIQRFLTAHAILLSFRGLPGIYFHSLFGSHGWPQGVQQSGRNRTINREKLQRDRLEAELSNANSFRAQTFRGLAHLLAVRGKEPAFSPWAPQQVPEVQGSVLALVRGSEGARRVLCLHNLTGHIQTVDLGSYGMIASDRGFEDLITGQLFDRSSVRSLSMQPYQAMWLAN